MDACNSESNSNRSRAKWGGRKKATFERKRKREELKEAKTEKGGIKSEKKEKRYSECQEGK